MIDDGGRCRGRQKAAGQADGVQAAYYLITGLWPLAHLRSFEALTGPKPDRFVVESTGMLFVATGATLAGAAVVADHGRPIRVLSVLTPIVSTFVTLRHRRRVRAVYVADALAQCALATWVAGSDLALTRGRVRRRAGSRGGEHVRHAGPRKAGADGGRM